MTKDKSAKPYTLEEFDSEEAKPLMGDFDAIYPDAKRRLRATVLALSEARAEVERLKKHAEALAVRLEWLDKRRRAVSMDEPNTGALAAYRAEYPEET